MNSSKCFKLTIIVLFILSLGHSVHSAAKVTPKEQLPVAQNYAAIVIDNLNPRLPRGLESASIVYEAEVEGGITRLMAIVPIQGMKPMIFGPVRSARPYFVDWALEVNAVLVHVGGSPEANHKIRSNKIRTLDQFYNASLFSNGKHSKAPHHFFIKTSSLQQFVSVNKNQFKNSVNTWSYATDVAGRKAKTAAIHKIKVPFSKKTYQIEWIYNSGLNNYIRKQSATDKSVITAKNIVFLYTDINVMDKVGRLKIKTTGSGNAKIFLNGQAIQGKWVKSDFMPQVKFYDLVGKEIQFQPGMVWIEVLKN